MGLTGSYRELQRRWREDIARMQGTGGVASHQALSNRGDAECHPQYVLDNEFDSHTGDVNGHHTRLHGLVSALDHSVSGLTEGHYLRASGPTSVAFSAIQADDIPDISATYVPTTRTITSGDGLSGGGALSGNLTLAVSAGVGISVAADAVAVDQSFAPTWTGTHTFQATMTARDILPERTDTYDLGSYQKWWKQSFISQLNSIVMAENTLTLLGGWFLVAKNQGKLPAVTSAQTQIDFGTAMTVNDFVKVSSHDTGGVIKTEYMQIVSLVSGTTYNVTRDCGNLHGTDPAWPDGTPWACLGYNGTGRIELNAYDTPRISLVGQGAAYNSQTEMLRIGDLDGNWGYSAETYGMAIGEYGAGKPNIILDPTNGLRIRNYQTDVLKFDTLGAAYIAGVLNIDTAGGIFQGTGTFASPTTGLKLYNSSGIGLLEAWGGGTKRAYFGSDGNLSLRAGTITSLDTSPTSYLQWVRDNGELAVDAGAAYISVEPLMNKFELNVKRPTGGGGSYLIIRAKGSQSSYDGSLVLHSGDGMVTTPYAMIRSGDHYLKITQDGEAKASTHLIVVGNVITSPTWNNVNTTFTALRIGVTDTASKSDSKLLDMQVGGASKFSVDKTGNIVVGPTWTNWTPTVTQSESVSVTVNEAKYCLIGKVCHIYANLSFKGTGTGGNNIVIGGLPAAAEPACPIWQAIGTVRFYDSSATTSYVGSLVAANPVTSWRIAINGAGTLGSDPNIAIASGDDVRFTATYRVA